MKEKIFYTFSLALSVQYLNVSSGVQSGARPSPPLAPHSLTHPEQLPGLRALFVESALYRCPNFYVTLYLTVFFSLS